MSRLTVVIATLLLHASAETCTSKLTWIFQTNKSLGYCHMAMIEQMGDGTLVAAFQAAKVHESYNDQAIYASISSDEGASWSDISQVLSGGDYAVWGPVLHWDAAKSTLMLFYAQSGAFDPRAANRSNVGGDVNVISSADGKTWSAPRTILPFKTADGLEVPKVTANKPIVLSKSQNLLLPFWQTPSNYEGVDARKEGKQKAGVLLSKDGGATFVPHYVPSTEKVIENTLAETRNGSILQLFRTGTGHLYESWSHDGGETWSSTVASSLPNPNAKTFMFTDSYGDQIIAYNPTTKGRNPLALARSTDDGVTFKEYCNLDAGIKSKALEYPTSLQVGGKVFTVFSADHYTGIKLSITELPHHMSVAAGCTKDTDCSLNGVCAAGICTCDSGWIGDKCQTLDLIPGPRTSGYRNINDPLLGNTSSWGGGSWYDAKDGKWYMWATELADHCGMHTWTTNSQTIRASSAAATGHYQREAVQIGIWSHEVVVTRGPAGEYVAYFSYNANPGSTRPECKLCTDGSTNPACKKKAHLGAPFIEVIDPTYMSWSATATGNWSEPVMVLGPKIVPTMTPMDTNMAVVINKDGSVNGMWRDHHPTGKSVPHLVTATNWKDPGTYKFSMDDLLFGKKQGSSVSSAAARRRKPTPGSNPGGLEDMFLWVDARGHYHAVFHQMYTCLTCTAHAYSVDGVSWSYGGTAATAETTYTDGGKETFGHCERPHMIFDKDGVTPVALTNGVKIQGLSNDDLSFTLLRPLRQKTSSIYV